MPQSYRMNTQTTTKVEEAIITGWATLCNYGRIQNAHEYALLYEYCMAGNFGVLIFMDSQRNPQNKLLWYIPSCHTLLLCCGCKTSAGSYMWLKHHACTIIIYNAMYHKYTCIIIILVGILGDHSCTISLLHKICGDDIPFVCTHSD